MSTGRERPSAPAAFEELGAALLGMSGWVDPVDGFLRWESSRLDSVAEEAPEVSSDRYGRKQWCPGVIGSGSPVGIGIKS